MTSPEFRVTMTWKAWRDSGTASFSPPRLRRRQEETRLVGCIILYCLVLLLSSLVEHVVSIWSKRPDEEDSYCLASDCSNEGTCRWYHVGVTIFSFLVSLFSVLMLYSEEPRTGTRGIRLSSHNVFWRQKIIVLKRTCNIRRFAGCLLRGKLNSNGFKGFNGGVVELWILLAICFQKTLSLDNLPIVSVWVSAL